MDGPGAVPAASADKTDRAGHEQMVFKCLKMHKNPFLRVVGIRAGPGLVLHVPLGWKIPRNAFLKAVGSGWVWFSTCLRG